ncbi:MAG: NapC/NirT family cytochrome c [Thermodesulfovibrionales bacterium]
MGRLSDLFERILDHIKGFILALIALISVLGVIVGYKYYRHTQEDPEFCMSCHIMKEAFIEWERGKHRDVVCQKCHHLSILEQNQLLVAYVVRGTNQKFSQTHGRKKPWELCKKCHMDEIAQGSRTLNKSYGHARHVFIQQIGCKICHKGTVHNFRPNEDACKKCHEDKGVHGVGMEAFSCLKCHSFAEKTPTMIPRDRCIVCHKGIPQKGVMSDLLCHQCHKPHGRIKPQSRDCLGCHGNEATVGQHGFHMKKGLSCIDCHKAHSWIVSPSSAKILCTKCHSYKDPKRFIY